MAVENILKAVLAEIGLEISAPQIGSADETLQQIRALMNEAGADIARRAEWSRLLVVWDVPGGGATVAMPSDFHRMVGSGAVKLSKVGFHPVRAVTSSEQWSMLNSRPSTQPFYHMTGGALSFSPPLDADGATVRYVSKNWADGRPEITQNGDILKIPESLVAKGTVWRWKRQKGLPFDDIMAEYEADLAAAISADRGGS